MAAKVVKIYKPSLYIFFPMRTIESMRTLIFPVIVEKDDGGFFIECPVLKGAYSQGNTREEALANIKEAIVLVLEDMREGNEEIPVPSSIMPGAETVEVNVEA
jgi:predicted RNase H-like HicB family nuclease